MIEKGPIRFILLRGVLYWGVFTAILFSAFMYIFEDGEIFFENMKYDIWLFPLGGVAWGTFMWWWFTRIDLVIEEKE
jgi:hypothetical protein